MIYPVLFNVDPSGIRLHAALTVRNGEKTVVPLLFVSEPVTGLTK